LKVGRGGAADSHEGQYQCLESNASNYREPLEVAEEGFTWEDFGKLTTRHAAAFWMRFKGLIAEAGSPARRELQSARQGLDLADVLDKIKYNFINPKGNYFARVHSNRIKREIHSRIIQIK